MSRLLKIIGLFSKEPYILPKRPIILRSLLIVATLWQATSRCSSWTYMYEPCHTCMRRNEPCQLYTRMTRRGRARLRHMCMRHVRQSHMLIHTNESCHTWMRTNESCHTYERVLLHIYTHSIRESKRCWGAGFWCRQVCYMELVCVCVCMCV